MAMRDHHMTAPRERVTERYSISDRFGLSQVAAFALGLFNVVIGGVGLARTGVGDMTGGTTAVGGITMTGLLAVILLAIGITALAGAAGPLAAASTLMTFGAVFLAGGIIALLERVESLGWTRTDGIVFIVIGAASLVIGLVARGSTVVERQVSTTTE